MASNGSISAYDFDCEKIGKLAVVTKLETYEIINDLFDNFLEEQMRMYGVTQEDLDKVEEW